MDWNRFKRSFWAGFGASFGWRFGSWVAGLVGSFLRIGVAVAVIGGVMLFLLAQRDTFPTFDKHQAPMASAKARQAGAQ